MHISVVIPVYNEESYIGACLDSLMNQTRRPDVIYIVNNNSTDNTLSIVKSYSGINVINETTQGICAATQTGLDIASRHGGIILRCDADSRPQVNWIENIYNTFNNHLDIVAITGPGLVYDTNVFLQTLFDRVYMKPYFYLTKLALGKVPLFGSNFGIRAESWKRISKKTHLRTFQNIHDDMDISFHLHGSIFYDSSLQMPISARPFKAPWKMPSRYLAGFRSILIHWPEQAPWKRLLSKKP